MSVTDGLLAQLRDPDVLFDLVTSNRLQKLQQLMPHLPASAAGMPLIDQRSINVEIGMEILSIKELSREPNDANKTDTKTDTAKKKLPPHDVNNCIRYIRDQRRLIRAGKRVKASKKTLIAEHLGHNDTARMERQLRRDRYGWLLDTC